jgi:hypothetical protein
METVIFSKHDVADMMVRPLDGVTTPAMRERLVKKLEEKQDGELVKQFRDSLHLNLRRLGSDQFIIDYN